ncbi:MAG TPA: germination protein YpeB [Tissierellia bacterium]|nr:germination protein YpeB [Tissierellia bacterium]
MERRRWWIAPSILALALILSIAWGYREYQTRKQLQTTLENHYQRIFFDVKKHVENVQTNISKAMAANSSERNILLLSEIMNEAYFAQDKLAQMPIPQSDIANTQKFLNQAADYSYYLIQTHLEGVPLTKEQRGQLASLRDNSAKFNEELAKLQSDLADKNFTIGSMSNRQTARIEEGNENVFQTTLVNIDKNMADVPRLIYDGPFADEMINRKAVGLTGEKVSREEAERKVREFFGGNRVKRITAFEEGENIENVRIPSYTFSVQLDNASEDRATYIAVSRQGGHIVWMRNPRAINNEKLSIDQAQEKARRFLEEKGFDNMEVNYHQKYNGGILFNFALTEENVTIYPDLVKVKVALDNGEIIGFDATPYYTSHHERDIPKPKLSLQEARAKLRDDFEVNSERLAIIPKGKKEVLCYEFKGTHMNNEFIIYVNAENGREEDVLQLVIDENGTLTF